MATVSGVWVFPEVIELPDVQIEQDVNFTNTNANGQVFSRSAIRTVPEIPAATKQLAYRSKIGENFWVAYYANGFYSGGDYYDVAGWKQDYYRTVDFGSTPQEVSEEFYEWFTANATQGGGEEEGGATVAYNGSDLLSLEAGQTGTLNCAGNKMAGDVVVSFEGTGSVTYNGTTTEVEAGKTATLPCAGKKMLSDVVITVSGGTDELAGTWTVNDQLWPHTEYLEFHVSGYFTGITSLSDEYNPQLIELKRIRIGTNDGGPLRLSNNTDGSYPFSLTFTWGMGNNNQRWSAQYSESSSKYKLFSVTTESGDSGANVTVGDTTQLRTFTITSKLSEVENGDALLTWLKANATKQ